jgi:hypothetical protein
MEIYKLIQTARPELSALSIKTYTNSIVKLLELTKSNNISFLYDNPDKLINKLNTIYTNNNSKKTKLSSVIVFLKILNDKKKNNKFEDAIKRYSEEVDKYNDDIKTTLSTNEKNDKESTNWTSAEDVQKIKDTLKAAIPSKIRTIGDLSHYRDYVLFMFFDSLPSRADVADAKIIFKRATPLDDSYNWIVLNRKTKTAEYILNQYKTASHYGSKNIKLDDSLYPLLLDYKKNVDLFNNGEEWFLLNDSGKKMTRNRLSVIYSGLGESVNKKLGLSLNRHQKISNLVNIDAMQKLAHDMGNSIDQQVHVYAKKD